MDVLSSAVGGLCDPCGSHLIGSWLSWGCDLDEVLVDGVIFHFKPGAQHLPRALKGTAHPSLDIQNLITHIYVLIKLAIFPHKISRIIYIPSSRTTKKRCVGRGDMMVAVFDLIEGPCRDRSLGWCQNPSWLTVSSAGWQLEGFGD